MLLEIQRMYAVVPVAGPRATYSDTLLDGFVIPKVSITKILPTCIIKNCFLQNTTVLYSIYSVHMDKEYWGDPNIFRPERFLNADGKIEHEERILTFGYGMSFHLSAFCIYRLFYLIGKRRCIGEILAKSCLFIFFTEILRKYSITLASDSPQPKGIPVPGITLTTEEYTVQFTERETNIDGL